MKDHTSTSDYGIAAFLVFATLAVSVLAARTLIASTPIAIVNPIEKVDTTQTLPASAQDSLTDPWLSADLQTRIRQLTGRFNPANDAFFQLLPSAYTDGEQDYLLRKEAAAALMRMIDAANQDQVSLRVRSATRNFDRQAQIWGAKWRGETTLSNGINLATANLSDSAKARMILLYSSMPGTSRHHWGTDVDLNAFENDYFSQGKGLKEYQWLQQHASKYGFYQPYTSKVSGRTGYEEEKWHWSYKPISFHLLKTYQAEVTYQDISGFDGAAFAKTVNAIQEYVNGVGSGLNE